MRRKTWENNFKGQKERNFVTNREKKGERGPSAHLHLQWYGVIVLKDQRTYPTYDF